MPSIQDLKSNLPATGVEELVIGDLTLPHAIICRWIEVVDAPTSDPYARSWSGSPRTRRPTSR